MGQILVAQDQNKRPHIYVIPCALMVLQDGFEVLHRASWLQKVQKHLSSPRDMQSLLSTDANHTGGASQHHGTGTQGDSLLS